MRSSAHKKQEYHESKEIAQEVAENVVEFVARSRLIAKQAEEACHLEGNLNSPDFDVFGEKYKLSCFA